ncbi:MAG: HAMP domain-containing sensor histidine kinase [Elusimicrobia bacterium]|nr:HAMP domain-containing sensor histidine kinase [Elusimicrobiota bacterium]
MGQVPKPAPMRLSYRLAFVFAVSGGLVAGGLVLLGVRSSRHEAYAQAEHLGGVTLTAVRAVVQSEARQGRLGQVGKSFTELLRQARIATIVVRDKKGKRLVGSSEDPKLIGREPKPGRRLAQVDDGIYDVEGPVDLGPRGRGVVQVGFRTDTLERRLDDIGARGVQAGVTAFLAITLIAWLIGLFAGERLERLVGRLEAMAADPQNFRRLGGGEGGGDEVSRLSAAFNRMGVSLKAETRRRRTLEAEKRELAAMLVHDLKTPMTVIRSGITLLADFATKAGKREHNRTFELLEMSTARLQRMVEDVLQLAKLEEMSGLSYTELVEMSALARACAKDFGLIVADRKQTLDLRLPDEAPPPVLGDPGLLRRVLDNLVHNAVEHTPSGGRISIEVRCEGANVLVEVSDSGPGVPPEAREQLFLKFFQRDMKRHVGNVGLGLALCEKVVTRHGGAIGVGDAAEKGARFYFTLPVAPEPEAV